jgi:F0F1-type ATP synthase membrane subunit b/b'
MTTDPKNPLETAAEVLGDLQQKAPEMLSDLQEQAQGVIGDLAANAEKMADSVLGEANVDQIKDVLNTDVVDLAKDLMDKVTGKENG